MERIKELIRSGRPVFGFCVDYFCRPLTARLFKNAGADFVYLENEHNFYGDNDINDFVSMCKAIDIPVIAKIPYLDRGVITKMLDIGVIGMQLPMTETGDQIDTVRKYMKFPPDGIRAAGHDFVNRDYEDVENYGEWLGKSNRSTILIAHVETKRSLDNIDQILDNDHVDVMFVGAYDLSVSLGYPGDMGHPEVRKAIKKFSDAAYRHKKVAGLYVADSMSAEYWYKEGYTFFEISSEVELIQHGSKKLMEELRRI